MNETLAMYGAGAVPLAFLLARLKTRLELSKAKHPSLRGHARISRFFASLVPYYEYTEEELFRVDGAPQELEARRRAGLARLEATFKERFPKSAAATAEVEGAISDLQFTSAYRAPFQFSRYVRSRLKAGAFLESSSGVTVKDLDGNVFHDLTGAYGVNVFGYDFYKECMERGAELVKDLGPVLGPYHPVMTYNVKRLQQISGLDEISFHMSGTEAVMQAVRLARYHTKKTHLVRFCGAYHGWWGDVQPGVGNPQTARETYTLKEMDDDSLRVIARRKDIACVLVNPLQALHPNGAAPSDGQLLDSGRSAGFDKVSYTRWLQKLRAVCTEKKIPLLFDEVFLGFRLAPGGCQEYFGVRADLVTYGKTLGGGLPVGVVCGRKELMKRFRADRPADICFARGTFNSHPQVMGAMHEFLKRMERPEVLSVYERVDSTWNGRADKLNHRLASAGLPIRITNLQTIWTVLYTQPGCYNWLLQYYLRAAGLLLSWVGTGRFIFSLNYSEADFDAVCDKFLAAAKAMQDDGFFWKSPTLTDKEIKRRLLREMWAHR
jgi:glutamate-1-semialdehyde 2,1-aminomutase